MIILEVLIMKKLLLLVLVLFSVMFATDYYFRPSSFDEKTGITELTFSYDYREVGKIYMKGIEIIDQKGNIPDGTYKYRTYGQPSNKSAEGECTIKNNKINGLYKMDIALGSKILEANYKESILNGWAKSYSLYGKNKIKWQKYYVNGVLEKTEN